MRRFRNKKQLKVFMFALISLFALSIGYASISSVNLIVNGNVTASVNQNNFKVHFTDAEEITGTTGVSGTSLIDDEDDTIASFNVTGLSKVGDYAEAYYVIKNDSSSIGSKISLDVANTNNEYFVVNSRIFDTELQAGDTTNASVKIEMIKTPIENDVSTDIMVKIIASPLENSSATGDNHMVLNASTYTTTNMQLFMNSKMPSEIKTYTDPLVAMFDFGYPTFLKQEFGNDNEIIDASVGFIKNNNMYYLKGGVNGQYYNDNRNLLLELFGSDYCQDNSSYTICGDGDMLVGAMANGVIGVFSPDSVFDFDSADVTSSSWFCARDVIGISQCYRRNEGAEFYSSWSHSDFSINDYIPIYGTTFNNYEDAMKIYGHPVFIRHNANENNIIVQSSIGFKLNNQIYYLKGGFDDSGLIYDANKQVLKSAYGTNWSNYCEDDNSSFRCTKDNLTAIVYDDGQVIFGSTLGEYYCSVDSVGTSHCE